MTDEPPIAAPAAPPIAPPLAAARALIPAAPPTTPGEVRLNRPTAWPIVLGVLGITWGFIVFVAGMFNCGVFLDMLFDGIFRGLVSELIMLASMLLLIGSAGCVARRGWARGCLWIWAFSGMALSVAYVFRERAHRDFLGFEDWKVFVTGMAIPAFVLFWIFRPSIKREMLGWKRPR